MLPLQSLQRRYATKHFDPSKKISDTDLHTITESFRLSPSSFGLQGRGCVVVQDVDIRSQLLTHSYGQAQVVDASHLLVLCRRTDIDSAWVIKYTQSIADTRDIPVDTLDEYRDMMDGFVSSKSSEELAVRLTKQVYIAAWITMMTCAELGIDACPMEGFDPSAYDELLDLPSKHLASCMILPIGYRAVDDSYATWAKVRFPREEMIKTV